MKHNDEYGIFLDKRKYIEYDPLCKLLCTLRADIVNRITGTDAIHNILLEGEG